MKIAYTNTLTKIFDSYLLTDIPSVIDKIIDVRRGQGLLITRTRRSYIAETKAHNRMYKLHMFRKHTQDTDLEENIKLWKEVVYFIIGI